VRRNALGPPHMRPAQDLLLQRHFLNTELIRGGLAYVKGNGNGRCVPPQTPGGLSPVVLRALRPFGAADGLAQGALS
jgi:hypothetical protein